MFISLKDKKAFSVVEMLIVIALALGLAALTFGAFSSSKKTSSVNSGVQIVLSALQEARVKTFASQDESVYGVHFDSDKLVLFKGGTYSAVDPDNEEKKLPSGVVMGTVSLNGGGDDVVFDRLTGTTSQYGTIEITSSVAGVTRVVTVEQTGVSRE